MPTLLLSLLAGCDNAPEPCVADLPVWADDDRDGFGGAALDKVCKVEDLEEGQVQVAGDCDDTNESLNPGAIEACDGIDNDCDGQIDDDANLKQYWYDHDGDGFGGLFRSELSCSDPGDEWVANSADCDDDDPAVNPEAQEICGRVDEDCDGYVDESDDSVDTSTFSTFYADDDGDNFGDRNDTIEGCRLSPGYVLQGNDCDDTTAELTQQAYYEDADGDGYGDPAAIQMGCRNPPPGTVDNDLDCDDTDPALTYESDWFVDDDGDLYGGGVSVAFGCTPPYPGTVRDNGDCDEDDALINPDASDVCEDGIDQDCSGSDAPCGPIGSFRINQGPSWTTDPPVLSCVEACAQLFGGDDTDYQCSTSGTVIDNMAFLDGWGDSTFCFVPQPEDWKLEQAGNPGYNCGFGGCAYSALVMDHSCTSTNWCWAR
jgi:hypothetical protein